MGRLPDALCLSCLRSVALCRHDKTRQRRIRQYSVDLKFNAQPEPLFVTCPVCGKVNQKSLFTYSEVRCQRCHRELTAFADLGVVVGIDMNKKRSKEEVDRLEMYMSHLVGVLRDTEE